MSDSILIRRHLKLSSSGTIFTENLVFFNKATSAFCCVTCNLRESKVTGCHRALHDLGYHRTVTNPDFIRLLPKEKFSYKLECIFPRGSEMYPKDEVTISNGMLSQKDIVVNTFHLAPALEESVHHVRIRCTITRLNGPEKVSILLFNFGTPPPDCPVEDSTTGIANLMVRSSTEDAYHAHLGDKHFYRIDPYKCKGRVLIISNDFQGKIWSDLDVVHVTDSWKKLGFEVVSTRNLTAQKMLESCRLFAANTTAVSVVIVVIMSHGGKSEDRGRYLVGEDNKRLPVDAFISVFTSNKSPHLQDTPKVFLLEAVRGATQDYDWEDIGNRAKEQRSLSERYNMLIEFTRSALQNRLDWGSFTNYITSVFMECAHDTDVLDMLSIAYLTSGSNLFTRQPQSHLTKALFLFPGWPRTTDMNEDKSLPETSGTDISAEDRQIIAISKDSLPGKVDDQSSTASDHEVQIYEAQLLEHYVARHITLSNETDKILSSLERSKYLLENLKDKSTKNFKEIKEIHDGISCHQTRIEAAKYRLDRLRWKHETAGLKEIQEKVDLLATTFDEVSKLSTAAISSVKANLKPEFNIAVEAFYSSYETEKGVKFEQAKTFGEKAKDGQAKLLEAVEAGNQCIEYLPESAESVKQEIMTMRKDWREFLIPQKDEEVPVSTLTDISTKDRQVVPSPKDSPMRDVDDRFSIQENLQVQHLDGSVPATSGTDKLTEDSQVAPSSKDLPMREVDDHSSIPENLQAQQKEEDAPVSTLPDKSTEDSQVNHSSKDSPMKDVDDHSSIRENLQAQEKDETVPISTLTAILRDASQVVPSSEDLPMINVNDHSSIPESLQAQHKEDSVPVSTLAVQSTENSQVVPFSKESPMGVGDDQSSIPENPQDPSKIEEYKTQRLMLSNDADELTEYLKDLEHTLKNLKEGKKTEMLKKARKMQSNLSGRHANIESAKERLSNLYSEHQTPGIEKLQEKVHRLKTIFDDVSKLCTAVINDLEGKLKDEFNTAVESFHSWNKEETKLENLKAYRERKKDGRTKLQSVIEAGNQCIVDLPEGAETIEDQVETVKMYWRKFLSKTRRTRRLLGASPGPSPEKPKDQVSLITGLEEGMKRLQSTEVQQEHENTSVLQGKQTQVAGMLTAETALALPPGKKDGILISVDKNAEIPTNGGEIKLGGCIVTFPSGGFDDVTKAYAKAEIDSSKWPPKYIGITAMLWVECQRKLLAKASVKMQSWCVSGVDCSKIEVHILHQKKDSSTWDVVGTLPLNDLKIFQFDCMDFSPYILGIPESEFPATKLVIDGHVFAGPLNDYTLAFFLQHPLIERYVREQMERQGREQKMNFNSLMVKIEDKISAYLDSTDDNFQFPEAFRELFKVDSVFVRLQRTAFFHSFLNRLNNQVILISFKCGVHKNDITADGPHHLRCLWTPFPGDPVEGPEGREIPQQAPAIPEARLEVRGLKIHLSWREPGVGGRFTYCINVYCDGQRCEAQPLKTPDTNIEYSKIKPSSKYHCEVWAVNADGVEGRLTWSNSVQTHTGQRAFADPTSTVIAIDVRKATEDDYNAHLYDDGIYTIDRNRRKGRVLIVNNDFRGTQSWRKGSEVDVRNMRDLWTKLGFDVIATPNLTAQDMLDSCLLFARDSQDISLVVVIIMSHGGKAEDGKEFCQGKDDAVVLVDDIIALFETAVSPHLQGIPKLFMFQACRGREEDVIRDVSDPISEGQTLARQGPDPPQERNPAPRTPQRADMLITFPTQSGYMAIRNTRDGSWLMNAITHVFMEHAHDKHILELFTMVNRIVGQRVSRYSTVQISNQQSYLTKDLFLFPGWPNQ